MAKPYHITFIESLISGEFYNNSSDSFIQKAKLIQRCQCDFKSNYSCNQRYVFKVCVSLWFICKPTCIDFTPALWYA